MAVSTTTTAWNSGYLVTAYGTEAEVHAEMAAGADGKCPLVSPEFLMAFGGTTAGNCVACWYYRGTLL